MKKITVIIIFLLLVLILTFFYQSSIKDLLRDYFPIYTKSYINELNNNKILKFTPKDQATEAFRSFFVLEDKLFLQKIEDHEYYVDANLEGFFYDANFLKKVKNDKAIGTSYISTNKTYIFIAQENGLFFKINIEDLDLAKDFIEVNQIKSNIFNVIRYYDFYGQGQYGIKGFLVDEKSIYIAFSNQVSDECFNVSILKASLNLEFLNFEEFFIPNECIEIKNDYGEYNASDSGGYLAKYDKDNFLFSTGTFRYRDHAQDLESELGKILLVEKSSGLSKILSYGHRNVQGIVYLKDKQQIWSTEHGPNGGDEINLNQFESIDPINFGWPISSYGYHYASSEVNIEGAIISDLDHEFYKKAPLHKSHDQFGFEEPKLFFTPSIGISAISSVESEFIDKNVNLLFSSMGIHGLKNEKSIFAYNSDKNSFSTIFFGERIRDMKYMPNQNVVIFNGESSGMIGFLTRRK